MTDEQIRDPDDAFLDLCRLLREARQIIESERRIVFDCNKERDGRVRDFDARRMLAKYDRWLKRSNKVLP